MHRDILDLLDKFTISPSYGFDSVIGILHFEMSVGLRGNNESLRGVKHSGLAEEILAFEKIGKLFKRYSVVFSRAESDVFAHRFFDIGLQLGLLLVGNKLFFTSVLAKTCSGSLDCHRVSSA